jgi:hypothetical protein
MYRWLACARDAPYSAPSTGSSSVSTSERTRTYSRNDRQPCSSVYSSSVDASLGAPVWGGGTGVRVVSGGPRCPWWSPLPALARARRCWRDFADGQTADLDRLPSAHGHPFACERVFREHIHLFDLRRDVAGPPVAGPRASRRLRGLPRRAEREACGARRPEQPPGLPVPAVSRGAGRERSRFPLTAPPGRAQGAAGLAGQRERGAGVGQAAGAAAAGGARRRGGRGAGAAARRAPRRAVPRRAARAPVRA